LLQVRAAAAATAAAAEKTATAAKILTIFKVLLQHGTLSNVQWYALPVLLRTPWLLMTLLPLQSLLLL